MHPPKSSQKNIAYDLSGIVYILALLLGILLFLFFGEPILGIKPNQDWIALLMGLSIPAIILWVLSEIHKNNRKEDHHGRDKQ